MYVHLNVSSGNTDSRDYFQVRKADIEGYTGDGKPPPAIETIIKAESDKITPPDLTVEATINGLRNSAKIEIKKEAQNVVECVCQVFCHKLGLNWWRAIIAFFPKSKQCLKVTTMTINTPKLAIFYLARLFSMHGIPIILSF